ncbi:transmembrane protein 177 [Calliopsis andreniformis]|uniref:transmembrane protein 177 n=1 Tax=Calliopsis andreniformis TaxID=337506 RepID=UPI003FCDE0B7
MAFTSFRRYIVGGGTALVAVGITQLPHTYFLETIRQIKAKYRYDETEEPVRKKLQQTFEDVLNDLPLKEEQKNDIRLFHVYGYDLYHAGILNSKFGAVVGVPITFVYDSVESMNKNDIFMYNVPVDWNRSAENDFLKSLVLSENAQKYAIAREILKIKEDKQFFVGFKVLLHVLIVSIVYNIFYEKLNLASKNKLVRYTITSLTVVGGIASWIGLQDAVSYNSDIKIDKTLCALGKDYIEGGKEFYEKLLSRNIALRTILGDEGKKLFTVNGNENYILRQRNAPVFYKKNFFDEKLRNIEQLV